MALRRCTTYFTLALCISIYSCGPATLSGPKIDLTGYQTESIGGGAESVLYQDANLFPLSEGHVIQGIQNGAWTTFHAGTKKINKLTNYINGKKNGPEIILNDRGQLEEINHFPNGALHGLSAKYRNGRPVTETTYTNGKVNGPFAVYDEYNGKLQRSGHFKNGEYDGELYYFGPDGQVTMKYIYENGKKLSGGIVE